MQYIPPIGAEKDAPYIDENLAAGIEGSPVPAAAIEHPQREIMSVITAAGLTPTAAELDQLLKAIGKLIDASKSVYDISMTLDYFLGWNVWTGGIHQTAKPGMIPTDGRWVDNADVRYPKAWEYLQGEEGQQLCVTAEVYQALNVATWHTNADGTKVGWQGVGGVPKYCLDLVGKRIRVPDLRGMSPEVFGCDLLGVGGVHGWGIPNFPGRFSSVINATGTGPFYRGAYAEGVGVSGGNAYSVMFDPSRVVPVANKVQPSAWGSLACVYLGVPQS